MGKLYFGDNLAVLREQVKDATVSLVYLDPPFNSKAQYNLLFKTSDGDAAAAQLEAFRDTWRWEESAQHAFESVIEQGGAPAKFLAALRGHLGTGDMMAYLAMMTARLIELYRALEPTGSLYLHCDSTASHYLKVMLDAIFGGKDYKNEIIWQRNTSHNSAKRYGRIHDTLLFYTKSAKWTWNKQYTGYSNEQLSRYKRDENGDLYKAENLTAERRNSTSGKFEWRGTLPGPTRGWAYELSQLEEWWDQGRILTRKDGSPRLDGLKVMLTDIAGQPLQDMWTDIGRIANVSKERLGYPTQKPRALLERIISVSSNAGDLVLDPFCGCGTTMYSAQALGRGWMGIDVTHHAICLIEEEFSRRFSAAPLEIFGRPQDLESARELARRDKYQFQWWANWLFGVQGYRRSKGADRGIDGEILFLNGPQGVGRIIISVKGGESVGVQAVRELDSVVKRENADMGVLISLGNSTPQMRTEAAAAGNVMTVHGDFPRLQLAPISDVFAGNKPRLPVRAPLDSLKRRPKPPSRQSGDQLGFTFSYVGGQKGAEAGDLIAFDPRVVPLPAGKSQRKRA